MGALISRFRRQKPTTLEQLIKIEESVKKIEDYRKSTELKQKRTVANILIYGAAVYVLACVIVFVWYLPESWLIRLGLLIPFILVPFIIFWMKKLISGYFNSKMIKANKEYEDLQKKKKELIDNIMETETFNKAKEILSKYAPEKLGRRDYNPASSVPQSKAVVAVATSKTTLGESSGLRMRKIESKKTPTTIMRRVENQILDMQHSLSIPKPMFSRNRGFTDKLIEYIVGDGPTYRYALICKHCNGHNGMALEEEFPYMAYNCCYCLKHNPARSRRTPSPAITDSDSSQNSILDTSQDDPSGQSQDENIQNSTEKPLIANTEEFMEEEVPQGDVEDIDTQESDDSNTSIQTIVNAPLDKMPQEPETNEDSPEPSATQDSTADSLELSRSSLD